MKKNNSKMFNEIRTFLEYGGIPSDRAEIGARILIRLLDKRKKVAH